MKSLLALYFFILAAIQAGLLFGALHYYYARNLARPSFYWIISLGANAIGMAIFGLGVIFLEDVAKPDIGFTIANTFFYIATLFQGIFCRSLHSQISRLIKLIAIISIFVFVISFEFMRIYANFEIRTLFMVTLGAFLFGWQIYELMRVRKGNPSHQLIYLQYTTVVELFFALSRACIIIWGSFSIRQVEQLPQALIFITIAQFVVNTISYIAIGGYWSEKVALSNAKFSMENDVIKKLLDEREQMISHLSLANKTAITGALSASIAHELNQPIGAIQLNIQLFIDQLKMKNFDFSVLRSAAFDIEEDNKRIANIVATLRGVFRQDEIHVSQIDLGELLGFLMPILLPQAKERVIQIECDLNAKNLIDLNSSEFQIVLLNLIKNSMDALVESRVPNKKILIQTFDIDDGVHFVISDNGPGVSESLKKNLFELMKTNKASGLGLGLWLSKYIIDRHQGSIDYQTSSLGGAKFLIKLPLRMVRDKSLD